MSSPEEMIIISELNISALQEAADSLPDEMKTHLENIKTALQKILESESYQINFSNLIRVIDYIFETVPQRFLNGGVDNAEGKNLGSLKVFSIALLFGLNTDQALKLFGEHWESVQNNPGGTDHPNIRELDGNGLEGVKIYGIPLKAKESVLQ